MSESPHIKSNNFLPVIGILCIDLAQTFPDVYRRKYHSYIVASYVKYLESAGATVIPIWNNRPKSYYEAIMNKINGILIPGGAIFFDKKDCTKELTNDCYLSSKYIYDIAKNLNSMGHHFPIWGTCLGYQLIVNHSAENVVDVRQDCKSMNCSLPVKFEEKKVLEESKLFGSINSQMIEQMSQLPFGYHFHRYCITKEDLRMFKIDQLWTVLATNQDNDGLEFISIIEHKQFPFFGSQFHPERVGYENFGDKDLCHHSSDCFELNRYLSKFFVGQCELNANRFTDFEEQLRYSIYNFKTIFTARQNLHWHQCFLFRSDEEYPLVQDKNAKDSALLPYNCVQL